MATKRTFSVGEYSEGMEWELEEQVGFRGYSLRENCPHAVPWTDEEGRPGVLVPRIVRAFNEGGFNTTHLCVDCLLEALK